MLLLMPDFNQNLKNAETFSTVQTGQYKSYPTSLHGSWAGTRGQMDGQPRIKKPTGEL